MLELKNIQSKLNAPKNQRNSFGSYNYRSAESILQAAKPLLAENDCTLTLSDDLVVVGAYTYVKATATIRNKSGETEQTTAFAREPISRKGMDDSQLTGASSSYARKYALCGLLAIDDNKDPDALNDHKRPEMSQELQKAIAEMNGAQDKDEVLNVWNKYQTYQSDANFSQACKTKCAAFKNNK
jgi:hypothetical protein